MSLMTATQTRPLPTRGSHAPAARRLGVAALAWLLTASGAVAQTPVSDFGLIASRVRVGDTISLTDSTGRRHKGMLFDLSATQLVLESGGTQESFPAERVSEITWQTRDPLRNGALIGMAILGGLAAIQSLTACAGDGMDSGHPMDTCGFAFVYTLGNAGLGAAIGAGVDALIPGRTIPVYRSPGGKTTARVSLSPIFSPRRQGLAATLRF